MYNTAEKRGYFSESLSFVENKLNDTVIDFYKYFVDYDAIFNQKIESCISLLNINSEDFEDEHNELIIMFKNEKGVFQKETLYNFLLLMKFYLDKDYVKEAYEVMCLLTDPDMKFVAYMFYALKLNDSCGKEFGKIYFEKAKKILESNNEIKENLVKKHNIHL